MNYAVENGNLRLMSENHSGSLFKAFAYIERQLRKRSPQEDHLRPKARTELIIQAKPQCFTGRDD